MLDFSASIVSKIIEQTGRGVKTTGAYLHQHCSFRYQPKNSSKDLRLYLEYLAD